MIFFKARFSSVNRVYAIGENSNFSSQLLTELQCVSPIIYRFLCIQYHVIVSSEIEYKLDLDESCKGEYVFIQTSDGVYNIASLSQA